jgi:DNA polymerase III subunit delta
MPAIPASDFLSRIQKGKSIPAMLLLGDEPYLRDTCRAQLLDNYVPEASRPWAVSRYSADRGETRAALEQAQSLPMLASQQVVFLEDAETIESLAEAKRDEAVKLLDSYLSDPAPFTVLVIEAAALDQRMKLAKLLAERALVVQVGLGENPASRLAAASALAKNLAAEEGIQFERGAAEALAEAVGSDLQRLKTELDKLTAYAAQRKQICCSDVAALVISEKTATIWELADLLSARQSRQSLEFLDRLLREGEEPLQMLGAMAWMYRKLIEASEIKGAVNGWQAARALGMAPDRAQLAVENARKISKPRLLAGLRALQESDDRLKRGGENARSVMEFLVTRLTAPDALPELS